MFLPEFTEGMEMPHKYGLACYRKTCCVMYDKERNIPQE